MKNLNSMGLKISSGKIYVLDQTLLPIEEKWLECNHPKVMETLIKKLSVRGAPLIGVAAAVSLAHFIEEYKPSEKEFVHEAMRLRESRPTAVNLMHAVDRMVKSSNRILEAEMIFEEDILLCERMANHGEKLITDGDNILTHCNAGGLATVGIGTSIGVIRRAHENGKKIHVYVDETRPLFQGARLTAWELSKLNIPHTLICDNMAAMLMQRGQIQKIFTGADRIAQNGDSANKIGTYSLAVLAKHHKIPFYIVAPYTTIDTNCPTGADIPIEERNPSEIRYPNANPSSPVFNPAFDVTPCTLITSHVLDSGIKNF